jgi:hypothetical protein
MERVKGERAKKSKKLLTDHGFLLGIKQEGERIYLEPFIWDCGWY